MNGNACPCCGANIPRLSRWRAAKPFTLRCRSCGAALRAIVPMWQNILAQLMALTIFWTMLFFSIRYHVIAAGFLLATVLSTGVALLPYFFGKLKNISSRDPSL
jgi:drug/metabolite transporter (DMT)-like permease